MYIYSMMEYTPVDTVELEWDIIFFHSRIKTHADVFGLLLKERLPQLGHHLVSKSAIHSSHQSSVYS